MAGVNYVSHEFVVGDVSRTLKEKHPDIIALLRLDTD